MPKLFKTTNAVGYIALITLVVVVLYVWDSYHKKNLFGLIKTA